MIEDGFRRCGARAAVLLAVVALLAAFAHVSGCALEGPRPQPGRAAASLSLAATVHEALEAPGGGTVADVAAADGCCCRAQPAPWVSRTEAVSAPCPAVDANGIAVSAAPVAVLRRRIAPGDGAQSCDLLLLRCVSRV